MVSFWGKRVIPKTVGVVILILVCACCTTASARYATPEGTNAGISPGDTIFNYEQNLNFSVFRTSDGLPPTAIAAKDSGGNPVNPQSLNNAILGTVNAASTGYYWPYNSTDSTWGTSSVIIANAAVGSILIRPVNTDVTPPSTDPPLTTIPYDMDVQFKLQSTNLNSGNFANPWYKYELTSQSRTWSSVINAGGVTVPLTNLMQDPTANNDTMAFSMQGQNVANGDLAYPFTMKFQTQLAATSDFPTQTLTFWVNKVALAANFTPSSTQMGQSVTLQIYGKPYMYYTATVYESDAGAPQFSTTGSYDIYTSQYNVTVHPGPSGIVNVTLNVPSISGDYASTYRAYYTTVYENDAPAQSVTAQLIVGGGGSNTTTSVQLSNPSLTLNEFFAIGDTIIVPVTVGSDVSKVYFFATGPNTCPNGVKPSQPWVCASDGDASTFDVLSVDSNAANYFTWDTADTGIAAGTYRIFGMTSPTGYLNRTLAAGNAEDYTDIDLTTPSINAKFPDEAPGFFAKGDYVVSLWTARGSPAKTGKYFGMIRWYILGTNFRYTGITQFPLLKIDGSMPSSSEMDSLVEGGADYPGYSGLNLGRNFSYNLDTGDYYVIYQHPMYNNSFDLYPAQGAAYTGPFDTILTSRGTSVDISTMQTSDALSAILALLNQSKIDDSLLTDHFTIQKPYVNLDPILNYEVGDDIPIDGETNLEQSIDYPYNQINVPADKLTFWVYDADLYNTGKTQSTYRIYSADGTMGSLAPGAANRPVSFDVPAAITSQMKPGEYVAVVSCEDIKYTNTFTFVLHEQGYRKKNGIAEPAIGSDFTSSSQDMSVVTLPTTSRVTVTNRTVRPVLRDVTTVPTTKSPGFGVPAIVSAAFAAVVLSRRYCRRRP